MSCINKIVEKDDSALILKNSTIELPQTKRDQRAESSENLTIRGEPIPKSHKLRLHVCEGFMLSLATLSQKAVNLVNEYD